MTNPTSITCERFADMLADFLEHDVDEATRADVERHALACADCGSLLSDLRRLRLEAANLPELAPSRDLWAGIEARITTPVVEIGARRPGIRGPRVWPWAAAAAVILVLATAAVTHVLTRRAYQPRQTASITPSASTLPQRPQARSVAASESDTLSGGRAEMATHARHLAPAIEATGTQARLVSRAEPGAEQVYDTEIARLRTIVRQRRSQLDPATLAIIEKNMAVIDTAIAQCKAALRRDPASRFLMQSLNNALDTKVELLRTAAMLPARTL